MSVWMFFIRRLCRKPDADEKNYGRRCIGQVVDAVCKNSDAAEKEPDSNFESGKQDISGNTHYCGQPAVAAASRGILYIFIVFYKNPDQKLSHGAAWAFLFGIDYLIVT